MNEQLTRELIAFFVGIIIVGIGGAFFSGGAGGCDVQRPVGRLGMAVMMFGLSMIAYALGAWLFVAPSVLDGAQ